jgi:hypothetical protein
MSKQNPNSVRSQAANGILSRVKLLAQTNGDAGDDAQEFARIALQHENDTTLLAGIYLRERDLTCFGLDLWADDEAYAKIRCLPFEGEIPCLYFIRIVPATGAPAPEARITPTLLSILEFVTRKTGGGVGIALSATPQSQLATDVRTGRRVRYKITKFAGADPAAVKQGLPPDVYWLERTETGRSGNSLGGAAMPIF